MSFGPYLSHIVEKRTEKEWNSNKLVDKYRVKLSEDKFNEDICFGIWLLGCKFYGAEWVERDYFSELDGILAPYIDHYIDPVETVRQIRDPPEYDD